MAIPSTARCRLSLLFRRPSLTPPASSATSPPPPPPSISLAAAKTRLRYELDPDKAVSIISSPSSTSASRYALGLTVRRLTRARRTSDIEALIDSRKSSPHASEERFLATLIHAYGTAGMLDRAVSLFELVPTLCSAPPTVISFNAVLSACIRARKSRSVPRLFAQLSNDHSIVPNAVSYGILIKSLCLNENSVDAFNTLDEMEDKGVKPNIVIYTTLLHSLYKEGKVEEAEKLWSEMVGKGCVPDLSAYNVKAMYKSAHGTPEEVEAVISEITSAGRKPDTITYNYLIASYCRNGRFEDAKGIYKGLYKKGGPNAATFNNFLRLLCENGDIDAGLEVFNDAVTRNRLPDFPTTSLLVEGLVKGSRELEAKAVIGEVKKRFPEISLSGWIDLEQKLGLVETADISDQIEAA